MNQVEAAEELETFQTEYREVLEADVVLQEDLMVLEVLETQEDILQTKETQEETIMMAYHILEPAVAEVMVVQEAMAHLAAAEVVVVEQQIQFQVHL